MTTDMLKAGGDLLLPFLTSTFNTILETGRPPAGFADSRTLLLFKKGDPADIALSVCYRQQGSCSRRHLTGVSRELWMRLKDRSRVAFDQAIPPSMPSTLSTK